MAKAKPTKDPVAEITAAVLRQKDAQIVSLPRGDWVAFVTAAVAKFKARKGPKDEALEALVKAMAKGADGLKGKNADRAVYVRPEDALPLVQILDAAPAPAAK